MNTMIGNIKERIATQEMDEVKAMEMEKVMSTIKEKEMVKAEIN
jgi:hypothetical protein